MSVVGDPWALGRLFLTMLIGRAQRCADCSVLITVHIPEMGITVQDVPELDTGGERRF